VRIGDQRSSIRTSIMKTLRYVSIKLIMVAIACSFVASAPIQPRPAADARLIVNRSADFGVDESINLAVDGVPVTVLGINQNYDGALPPGKHVLSISTNPKTYGQDSPSEISVNAEPGKTYVFTVVWDDSELASLEEQ